MNLPWQYRPLTLLRRLPRFPGKYRVANRWCRWCPDRGGVELPGPHGLRFRVPSLKEPIAFNLLLDGVYEPDTLGFLQCHLTPGDVYVDVGANVGVFALPAAHAIGPNGRVVAVEASAQVFEDLRHNAAQPCPAPVTVVHAAIAADDGGTVTFYDAPATKFGMGSRAVWEGSKGYAVPSRSIDGLLTELGIETVKVMKVDVEGFEVDVFRGAVGLLSRSPAPIILFEFLDWAERRAGHPPGTAQQFLKSLGYDLWRLGADGPNDPALTAILETGGEMIVARKVS